MPQTEIPAAAFADTKPHYDILDGCAEWQP